MVKTRTSVTTPSPSVPPNVIWFSRLPAVDARAMMKSSAGNAIVISVSRATIVSTQPR